METKSLIFLSLGAVVIPAGIAAVGRSARLKHLCAGLLIWGTTHYSARTINFFSREWYRGTTRGFEFCWLDFLWIFLFADELRKRKPGQRLGVPFALVSMGGFIAYNAVNILLSEPQLFGLFELSKMVRGLMVYAAVAYYVKNEKDLRRIVTALAITIIYEWFWVIHSRVVLGHSRADGTLFHANTLSMFNLIAVPVLFAVALSDVEPRLQRLCGVATFLGSFSVLCTVSRAGLVSLGLLLLGVALTCGALKPTPKTFAVSFALFLVAIPVGLKLAPSFQARFESEGGLSKEFGGRETEGRGTYVYLARLMHADHFFGVGLNNWSYWVSNTYGRMIGYGYIPYTGTGEAPPDGPIPAGSNVDAAQAPPAHSLYQITLGETGWPGVVLFAIVWLRWFTMGASFFSNRSPAFRSRFGIGVFFGLLGAFAQSFSEWEYRQTPLLFLLHILLGALAAVYPARPSVMARRASAV
ncbi:O-antigen ligase family protein [Corallococcus carmarthensis]|uniref:O-antigen ligase domain-containing protein n=1 Tax=Corallococcus carmarthensis TaxID=2316728 RepID=A0A3A8JGI0_9BACT|nr:hypothetical protein [Corallococcus carmarthensis]RKG94887.1 hypothetical protein D7X32_40805 [Corallococcus carmarthensis]